jgi:NhaP-type Na+/H+ or K+/H+ antiporter
MLLFERTLVLLAVAVVLLQLARRLNVPYPAMLALAGGLVAALPWSLSIGIEPHLALALFVAPAVMDTAFDMPPRELRRIWVPLTSLVVVLVLVTTIAVAGAGVLMAGLPWAAALALGAIVAPPDAAAAAAVLQEFNLPRRTMAVLQGESLLNDATALLIFGAAVGAAVAPGSAWSASLPRLLIAVPGGAVLGALLGLMQVRLAHKWAGTLAAIIVQFVLTYGTWILAERLQLSPIVAVVALAAVIARYMPARTRARDRVNTYAVWAIVVFVLNVLAFLIMGLQARMIVEALRGPALWQAVAFAGAVLAIVIGVRFLWVMLYGLLLRALQPFLARHLPTMTIPSARVGVLVSWCGMRGLVTLATAFALPVRFPGRDLIVLSAFSVVLGTLIIQGLTIRPLIALLRIAPDDSLEREVSSTRIAMLDAALLALADQEGEAAAAVRDEYSAVRAASVDRSLPQRAYDQQRMRAIAAERRELIERRRLGRIDDDAYHLLEEELDRAELSAEGPLQAG